MPTVSGRPRITSGRLLVYGVLALTTTISLFPLYWLLLTAFTPTETASSRRPISFRSTPRWSISSASFSRATGLLALGAQQPDHRLSVTAFHLFFDTLAGYAFAKKRFPGRNIFFG